MSKEALDAFGSILMEKVRDATIQDWEGIMNGLMKSERARRVQNKLSSFDPQQLEIVQHLISQVVDTTLHHLLWTLEQERSLDVSVRTRADFVPSIREISDGLAGELPVWTSRFSKKRYEPPV